MRAVGLWAFGGPDVLVVVDLPSPVPGPGELRVRVHAAALNPTDITFRTGGRAAWLEGRPRPLIPGMDFAGVVDQIGEGTETDVRVGDEVVGLLNPFGDHGGAYAEQVVVDARSVTQAPSGHTVYEAATLLLNAVTASLALDAVGAPEGGTVAVTGAAGAVGGYAVQLGRLRGLNVIADAAAADRGLVETFGAAVAVERGEGFAAAVRSLRPEGVAGVVDGAGLVERVLPVIADGGVLAVLKGQQPVLERNVRLAAISSYPAVTDHALLRELSRLAGAGDLALRVAEVFPAESAPTAHRRLAAGGLRGRLVLDFSERRQGR